MELLLQFPPTPEHAAAHAAIAVDAVRDIEGVELDYSPETLPTVDSVMANFHAEGLALADIGQMVFSIGCYVGEMLVRHCGGRWVMPGDASDSAGSDCFDVMVVKLPDESSCSPVGKAIKALELGEGESLAQLYRSVAG